MRRRLRPRGRRACRSRQVLVMYDLLIASANVLGVVLQDEVETAMRLCGITDLNTVRGDLSYLNTSELQQLLPPRPRVGGWLFGKRSAKL